MFRLMFDILRYTLPYLLVFTGPMFIWWIIEPLIERRKHGGNN